MIAISNHYYDIQNHKSEDFSYFHVFSSVCETASVASDLTRMYVSDEDEKPEVVRPIIAVNPIHDDPSIDENDELCGDLDDDNSGKRPRVNYFSSF